MTEIHYNKNGSYNIRKKHTIWQIQYHCCRITIGAESYHRSHPYSPTPHNPQCTILLCPPSLIPSFPPLGVPSAPPLVPSASPLQRALVLPLVFLALGRSGELQGHRLLPPGQTRGVGAGGTAAGAREVRTGGAARTLIKSPRPTGPPSGPGRDQWRSGRTQLLWRGLGHERLPNGGTERCDNCSLDSNNL